MEQNNKKMYQVSTLQALALGFSKAVTTVKELLGHGDIGLGTFEHVDGEMIILDGKCYRARNNGDVVPAEDDRGVPFAAVAKFQGEQQFSLENMPDITSIRTELTRRIEERFGLNSMPGWHLHFLSEDRSKGGHVFDVIMREGVAKVDKITNIFINFPENPAFDTYSLKHNLQEEIKSIE